MEWEHEIDDRLDDSQVVLLLVSADFIASDYCWGVEMKHTMEMHTAGLAGVIPVVLRHCVWHTAPFGRLQALPTGGKPVDAMRPRDRAFMEIAERIRSIVTEMEAVTCG